MDWIKVEDGLPEEGQEVWYYFAMLGIYHGFYKTVVDDDEPSLGYKYQCFYSDKGFLCDDVTHWIPYNKGDKEPGEPSGE